ncbi:MAG: NADAR family protein, partial [Gammaproteobacteria bacterium]
MSSGQTRTYERASSVVFLKTNEAFGGLSNMAGGFPLRVNGVRILTSEALYQACRFPHLPDVQRLIIEQRSPMTAKMKSKPHRSNSRRDWFQVRVKIMRWCLRVKLAQNWRKFSELLLETGDRPIVEQSRKDDFWGAKPVDDGTLVGMNVLGRLLMELREAVKAETRETLCFVEPLAIPDFLLGGEPIGVVATRVAEIAREQTQADVQMPRGNVDGPAVVQQSLFDEPVVKESPPPAKPGIKENGVRITDLKPYSEYKESGLPWLGQVPGHWEIRPAFGAFVPNRER